MSAEFQSLARVLIFCGAGLLLIGLLLLASSRIPWVGRLPGDIIVRREHFVLYVPLATSLLVSAVITLLAWVIGRYKP